MDLKDFKVFRNKKNNQLWIPLSRKVLGLKKNDNPTSIELQIQRIRLEIIKKKGDKP